MTKYIVGVDMDYYPWIEEYDDFDKAKARYDSCIESYDDEETVYFAVVIDMKDSKGEE